MHINYIVYKKSEQKKETQNKQYRQLLFIFQSFFRQPLRLFMRHIVGI